MRIQDIPWLDFTVPQKKLDVSVAATFDMGDYQTARTTQPVVLFRVTTAPVKGGPYWTTELPKDRMEAKMSLAVRPEWNQRQYYQTAVLPIGTEIQIGFAAPQGSFSYWQHAKLAGGEANMPYGRDLTGGCVQVFMDGGMPEQYVIESGRPLEFVSNYSEFDRKAVELEEAAARERAEAARIKRAPMTKNVSGQVRANAAFTQQDENGQVVSPNGTGQVIDGNVQTDIGHVSSFENKYEVKYSEKAGLTQQAHNQMFSNPGQFQVEPSRENRSHAFENHDENDAMMNKNHDYSAGERQRHGNACCEECEDRRNGAHRHLCVGASGGIGTSFGGRRKAGQSAGKRHAGNRARRNLETGNTGNGGGFCGDIQGNCAGVADASGIRKGVCTGTGESGCAVIGGRHAGHGKVGCGKTC